MNENTLGIVIAVYALILWVLLFFVWRKGYQEWRANRAHRLRKFDARVVDKRESSESERAGETEPAPEHLITFEFGGSRREFKVEPAVYADLRVGEEGTLQLRGAGFESFEPKSTGDRAEDVYRRMVKG